MDIELLEDEDDGVDDVVYTSKHHIPIFSFNKVEYLILCVIIDSNIYVYHLIDFFSY